MHNEILANTVSGYCRNRKKLYRASITQRFSAIYNALCFVITKLKINNLYIHQIMTREINDV